MQALRAVYRQKMAEFEVANHDVDYYKSQFERTADLQKKGHASQAKFDKAQRDWLMSNRFFGVSRRYEMKHGGTPFPACKQGFLPISAVSLRPL